MLPLEFTTLLFNSSFLSPRLQSGLQIVYIGITLYLSCLSEFDNCVPPQLIVIFVNKIIYIMRI